MGHIPLPEVDLGECCPTCQRPLKALVFGGFAEKQTYTTGLIGHAVDPQEIIGPTIDEAAN